MDKQDFIKLKQKALIRCYENLNEMQRRAVFCIDGPLLILAGAGSGKTTVLINRIEYMIRFGNAYHSGDVPQGIADSDLKLLESYAGKACESDILSGIIAHNPVKTWNILAITFTNKAAAELKHRLASRLGEAGGDVRASTFHSFCALILRMEIEALGYSKSFTIYDTDDSLRVIKDALKELNIDEKILAPKAVLGAIGRAKDTLITPEEMLNTNGADYRMGQIAQVYGLYQKRLKASNALDFDDIIINTVRLFQKFPDILAKYQNRYKYIMVDEYQDTNHAQYLLISQLAAAHRNLCVVGDDDQSIYKFRGATIENILSFEKQFENAAVIRLEQNYRSTGNILSAANSVIANNTLRKGKNLWTSAGDGEKIMFIRAEDETQESRLIADSILGNVAAGATFSEHAVLYRMNAQANTIEKSLKNNAIPYRVIGGIRFFDRKEIRDIVAYLSVLNNTSDTLRLLRVINEPKRGIGIATLQSAQEIADTLGVDLFEVISTADEYAPLSKKAAPLLQFSELINDLIEMSETKPLDHLLDELIERTGYMRTLETQGFEGIARIENVLEFKTNIMHYQNAAKEPTLSGFLEEISLYTDIDNYDAGADSVTLMTAHSAKGLEFRNVYIAGMDEGVFPGRMAMGSDAELEEERRLAYVAITRAKERLVIISAERRMIFGQTVFSRPSRFVGEIPKEFLDMKTTQPQPLPVKKAKIPKKSPSSLTSIGVGVKSPPAAAPANFKTGDRVLHKVFGEGTVISAKPMASDMLLEIDFGASGIKKVMANFARLASVVTG
ncbi:MAG: UvrD-helicase domain-containing protein [Oscillospiraceae bacterium]|nr:UvrD-helicase domain-containing protein [Oscillospiraceae bacterium]